MSAEIHKSDVVSSGQSSETLQQPLEDLHEEGCKTIGASAVDAFASTSSRPSSKAFFLTRRMKTKKPARGEATESSCERSVPAASPTAAPSKGLPYDGKGLPYGSHDVPDVLSKYHEGYSAGHRQGYQQGYQKGFQWGYQQGYQMAMDSKFKPQREERASFSTTARSFQRYQNPLRRDLREEQSRVGEGWGRNSFERGQLYRSQITEATRPAVVQAAGSQSSAPQSPVQSRIFRAIEDSHEAASSVPLQEVNEIHCRAPVQPEQSPVCQPTREAVETVDDELQQLLDGEGR